MRPGKTDIDLKSTVLVLVIVGIVGVIGLQIAGMDVKDPYQTEHYNESEAWCESENGSLALMNDAFMAEHNGFHCVTDDDTYHMHRVADLNYTHDADRLKDSCGTTHANTPMFIGCNIFETVLPALALIVILIGTIYGYMVYW